ncbi:hypothetical protein SXCC_03909 [Gluconacetobacter sp. SXCC-1]|nr:hypothetical protein SXCC_03909 [Gluconacetobacter sp. SXCC-1]
MASLRHSASDASTTVSMPRAGMRPTARGRENSASMFSTPARAWIPPHRRASGWKEHRIAVFFHRRGDR